MPQAFADQGLSWQDCVKESRAHHPDLLAARAKVDQARAEKGITRSSGLPQLTARASRDVSKSEGQDKAHSSAFSVSGRQLLFDGFKTAHDLAAAQEGIKSSTYNYQVVSSNVLLRLRSAYLGLLAAQQSLGVTQGIVERRQQNLDLIRLRYQSGREHKGSLLTAEANLFQAQAEHQQALRNIDLYQRKLTKELGRGKFEPVVVTGQLDVPAVSPEQPLFDALVEATPLLKELVAQKEAARLGVKSAKADFFPQVYADASAGKTGETWPPSTRGWSGGLSISFPLFLGGQQQASLAKAKASYEQAQADTRSGRDGVIFTLAQTWTFWQDAVAHVAVQQKFLEASVERARIAEGEYSMGLVSFNDWIVIEDSLVNGQKSILQAKMDALVAEASWLQAKGETLDE